jgi:hypothetical protein
MVSTTHHELSDERTGRFDIAFQQLLCGLRAYARHGDFPGVAQYVLHGSLLEIGVDFGHGLPDGLGIIGHSRIFLLASVCGVNHTAFAYIAFSLIKIKSGGFSNIRLKISLDSVEIVFMCADTSHLTVCQ